MNKSTLTIILILVVVVAGGLILWQSNATPEAQEASLPEGALNNGANNTTPPPPPASTPRVKEFSVEGGKFFFKPDTMTVKKGDTVRITFKNVDGFHDLKIDEFNVATKQIQGGASETVEFVADKTGTFEYYCSVGTHRQMGMKGTLTVTE